MRAFLVETVWGRLAGPTALILVHFVVSILAILSLAAIEWILSIMGLDGKPIPGTNMTLGAWTLNLEIFASSAIIIFGMLEALAVLALSIASDCTSRIREIRRAWN